MSPFRYLRIKSEKPFVLLHLFGQSSLKMGKGISKLFAKKTPVRILLLGLDSAGTHGETHKTVRNCFCPLWFICAHHSFSRISRQNYHPLQDEAGWIRPNYTHYWYENGDENTQFRPVLPPWLTGCLLTWIGFNVESVKYKNVSFDCWDAGGQEKVRTNWPFLSSLSRISTNRICRSSALFGLIIANQPKLSSLLWTHQTTIVLRRQAMYGHKISIFLTPHLWDWPPCPSDVLGIASSSQRSWYFQCHTPCLCQQTRCSECHPHKEGMLSLPYGIHSIHPILYLYFSDYHRILALLTLFCDFLIIHSYLDLFS